MFLPNTGPKLDRTASQCVFLEITGAFCILTMTEGMVGKGGLLLVSNGKEPWMPAFLHCTELFCTMMYYHNRILNEEANVGMKATSTNKTDSGVWSWRLTPQTCVAIGNEVMVNSF